MNNIHTLVIVERQDIGGSQEFVSQDNKFKDESPRIFKPILQRSVQPDDSEIPMSPRQLLESVKLGTEKQLLFFKNTSSRISARKDTRREKKIDTQPNYQPQQRQKSLIQMNNIVNMFGKKNLIRQFILLLKRSSNLLSLSDLTKQQSKYVLSNLDLKLFDFKVKQRNIFDHIPLFENQSWVTFFSDTILGTIMTASLFLLPIMVSFDSPNHLLYGVTYFIIIVILIDLCMVTNRHTIDQGNIISDRNKIVKSYVKDQMLYDILSIISLIFLDNTDLITLKGGLCFIYIICRLRRIIRIVDNQIENLNLDNRIRDIVSLLNMILTLIFIVHLIACVWHGIGQNPASKDNSWIAYYGFQDLSNSYRYQISFYWAAMTMTTVGYGDITPKSQVEYTCANITMLVSCIVFGYTLNRIGMLLTNIHLRRAEFKQNIAILNKYMNRNKVEYELQSQIRSYLDYMWQLENDLHQKEVDEQVTKLPDSLRQELEYQVRNKLISQCKVLKRFSNQLKRKLCTITENVCYASNEVILDPALNDEQQMYILQSGKTALANFNIPDQQLMQKAGDSIGEIGFFTHQPRLLKIVSEGFSSHLKIPKQQFMHLLNQHQQDKVNVFFNQELYFYIKDSLNFSQQYQKISQQCVCCESGLHLIHNCPYLHLRLDKDKIVKTLQYPEVQHRTQCIKISNQDQRKIYDHMERYKSILHLKQVAYGAQELQRKLDEESQMSLEGSEDQSSQDSDENDNENNQNHVQLADVEEETLKTNPNRKISKIAKNYFELANPQLQKTIKTDFKSNFSKVSQTLEIPKEQTSQESSLGPYDPSLQKSLEIFINGSIAIPSQQNGQTSQTIGFQKQKSLYSTNLDVEENKTKNFSESQNQQKKPSLLDNLTNNTPKIRLSFAQHRGSKLMGFSLDPIILEFDKMQKYKNYFPNGNYDTVIKKQIKSDNYRLQTMNTSKSKNLFSLYTFNLNISRRAKKFKNYIDLKKSKKTIQQEWNPSY